ncbi:MAG TPA: hypothetical protein ENJ65_03520 [Candidatus Tenderia electrophaga]|uniref:Uncharacterized protein n=1 Tax=Candidatus Tenderia electrophaga TaxID=1748243 RepID=A0A832J8X0_9GAMM|nr:hypothetical protein [Candidatus Tenderia electrophaga]
MLTPWVIGADELLIMMVSRLISFAVWLSVQAIYTFHAGGFGWQSQSG